MPCFSGLHRRLDAVPVPDFADEMTSGSCRIAVRMPLAKDSVSTPTSRCSN